MVDLWSMHVFLPRKAGTAGQGGAVIFSRYSSVVLARQRVALIFALRAHAR